MNATSLLEEGTNGDELLALLTEQCALYAQLGQLAQGQRSLITGDRPEQLLGVLGERQRLIDRLEALGARMRPYQRDWRAVRGSLDESRGRRVDELVARANGLLSGILQADEADAELLAARKSEAGQGVGQVKAVRQARAAYAGGGQATGSQLDWTGE